MKIEGNLDVSMDRDGVSLKVLALSDVSLILHDPAEILALAATLQAYGEQMQAIRLREVKR